MQRNQRKGMKWLSGLCLLAIAGLVVWMSWRNGAVNYYLLSTLVLLLALGAFFLSYERKKPTAQELVLLATLCAVAVVGRMVFAAVPFFKPAAAIVILTGIVFGGQAGFLCGAVSMLVSNFFFGQGAWTPWQMVAFGVAGLLAGICFRAGRLPRSRLMLTVFGALCVLVPVGLILDTSSLFLMTGDPLTVNAALTIYLAGVSANVTHGVATALFLFLIGPVVLEKLERVKVKYGLME